VVAFCLSRSSARTLVSFCFNSSIFRSASSSRIAATSASLPFRNRVMTESGVRMNVYEEEEGQSVVDDDLGMLKAPEMERGRGAEGLPSRKGRPLMLVPFEGRELEVEGKVLRGD
jgi:hypothetical protein